MRTGKLIRLARGNLARELGALAVSAGGVALGTGCLVFFLALGRGVQRVVRDVFPVSARELEVVVPQVGIGSLFGQVRLDDATVQRLRQIPGVRSVAVETREQAQVLLVQSAVGAEVVRALLNELSGTSTGKVVTREPTLEDAYVELVKSA
jgi:hypothetical protein